MIIQDLYESPQTCPECGGPSFSDLILAEKKDACYHKVKASAKVWPSAYASGRLVQCRKKGADNYGNKSESMSEDSKESYMIIRTDAEGKKDVFAGNFDTYEQAQKELDACLAHPLHTKYKQKFEIKRKGGEQGVAEAQLDEKCWDGYQQQGMKNKSGRQVPNCVPAESVNEMDKSQTPPGRDGSNDEGGKKEYTAKSTTAKKVAKDGEKILNKELNKKQGVAEAGDSNFVGFMNKTLADKVDAPKADPMAGAPDFYRNATVATLDGRKGFKNALKFGLKALSRLDPETRQQLAAGSEQAVANYLTDVAERSGQMGDDTFVEEDISEVQDYLSDVFHDPSINSWKDVLQQSRTMSESQLDEKSTSQAQFRTMAAAAHNPKFAKKVGISRDVAKEFHGADRKQDYTDLPKKADEGKLAPKEKEADYGDDYQAMVARVKKLAGLGPLKTVYDPQKRVYRNVPTAVQPKK